MRQSGFAGRSVIFLLALSIQDLLVERRASPPGHDAAEGAGERAGRSSLHLIVYEIVFPGFSSNTSTSGASFCNSPGVPVSCGNVPKCMGMTVSGCSSLQA